MKPLRNDVVTDGEYTGRVMQHFNQEDGSCILLIQTPDDYIALPSESVKVLSRPKAAGLAHIQLDFPPDTSMTYYSEGRNGPAKTSGVDVYTHDGVAIVQAVTSRGDLLRGDITMPTEILLSLAYEIIERIGP